MSSFLAQTIVADHANNYGATFPEKTLATTICSATVVDAPQWNGVIERGGPWGKPDRCGAQLPDFRLIFFVDELE